MSLIETGKVYIGRSGSVSKRVTVRFKNPHLTMPVVVTNTFQDPNWPNPNIKDTFAVSIVSVSKTEFVAQVHRTDANHGWGQELLLKYITHAPSCFIIS